MPERENKMAKKDNDNFDFDTESEGKGKFDLVGFFKNLTKQQKGIILAAVVGVVLVIAIVIACIAIGANGNDNVNSGNVGGDGSSDNGSNDDENRGEVDLDAEPTQIYVANMPTVTSYYVGDVANYAGLVIGVMEQNSSGFKLPYDEYSEELTITGFDSSVAVAEQVITVTYKEYTTTFTIEIKELIVGTHLVGITVNPLPTKTVYKKGEALDYSGGRIVCEYSDGSTKVIKFVENGVQITGFGAVSNIVGDHEITVEYFDDNGGHATTTFTITITE